MSIVSIDDYLLHWNYLLVLVEEIITKLPTVAPGGLLVARSSMALLF